MPTSGPNVVIDQKYFVFKYSRSSGPGGQNVNKLNTRATLFFDVANCPELSELQKKMILKQLGTRIDKKGVLRVVSQKYRTQNANRRAAIERLLQLMSDALRKKLARHKTAVPRRAKENRLAEKKRKSEIKKLRRRPNLEI